MQDADPATSQFRQAGDDFGGNQVKAPPAGRQAERMLNPGHKNLSLAQALDRFRIIITAWWI
jgi:hypothetical protein